MESSEGFFIHVSAEQETRPEPFLTRLISPYFVGENHPIECLSFWFSMEVIQFSLDNRSPVVYNCFFAVTEQAMTRRRNVILHAVLKVRTWVIGGSFPEFVFIYWKYSNVHLRFPGLILSLPPPMLSDNPLSLTPESFPQ